MDKTEMIDEMIKILSQGPDAIAERAKALFWETFDQTGASRENLPGTLREYMSALCEAIDALPETKGFCRTITEDTALGLDIIRRAAGIKAPDSK
jgi:hypothetical protein